VENFKRRPYPLPTEEEVQARKQWELEKAESQERLFATLDEMAMRKLWLDDERTPPDVTWVWVKTALDALKQLRTQNFSVISLDHDLGDNAGTGYEVLVYLETETYRNEKFQPPEIRIHTANPVARTRMQQGVESIRLRCLNRAK
jgi:hypothetical protein